MNLKEILPCIAARRIEEFIMETKSAFYMYQINIWAESFWTVFDVFSPVQRNSWCKVLYYFSFILVSRTSILDSWCFFRSKEQGVYYYIV